MAQLLENGAQFNGTYTIVRLIGRGGIGEVYEAKHDFLGRRVAIKCLRLKSTLPKTAAQRMAKEAQALCALDHPNIIRIHDAGVSGDLVFMVTELLEGGTLRDKLEAERRLMLLPALRYHLEWADALVQVHAAGIIHRDLKPENVFITKAGVSKLLDFGAALDSQRITMVGHTVGTPAYMAPEHLTGDVDIDERADVYPLGLMLYESLTGQHPFVLATDQDLPDHFEFARRHIMEPWPKLTEVLPGTPPSVEAIVDRCLAKNRDERFASVADLRDALRAVLDDATKPAALPLVSRAASVALKTKPMSRQTAVRLERGGAVPGRMTERMTPEPPIGGALAFAATAPLDMNRMMRAAVPTMEDRAVATPTPAPASPAIALAAPPKPLIPSRAPAAIAVLSIGTLALAVGGWLYLRSPASPPNVAESSATTATASATTEVAAPIVTQAPPSEPSASEREATATTPAEAPSAAVSAAPTAAPKPPPTRPTTRPRPTPPPTHGPVPIFER